MNDPKRILVVLLGLIVLIIGVLGIKGHIEGEGYKTQVRYTTAIKAEDATRFNYAVDTQQGNLLVNGVFTTDEKNLVKFPEMTKSFTFVERIQEHYTMHTRQVCTGSGETQSCHTETYYTWDYYSSDEVKASKVNFYERQYDANLFSFRNFLDNTDCAGITDKSGDGGWFGPLEGCDGTYYYIDGDDRYAYKTVPQSLKATFLASSMGGGLNPVLEDNITLENKSIYQVLKDVGQYKLVAFWVALVFIVLLVIGAVIGAYYWVTEDGEWSLYK